MGTLDTLKSSRKLLVTLQLLNRCSGMSIGELSKELSIPRTTAYRILESLLADGFVSRSQDDLRYSVTSKVLTLSEGYSEGGWMGRIIRPHLLNLGKQLVWPISFCVMDKLQMIVRETTDSNSPLVFYRVVPGVEVPVPVLASATGRVYMAYCGEEERKQLMSVLKSVPNEANYISAQGATIGHVLNQIVEDGYCNMTNRKRPEGVLAVPARDDVKLWGSVAVRYNLFCHFAIEGDQKASPTFA